MIKRTLIALLLSTTIIGSAHAAKVWLFGNGGNGVIEGGGGSGPTGNDLLLEDGSSFLLLEDGSSKLCLESGC